MADPHADDMRLGDVWPVPEILAETQQLLQVGAWALEVDSGRLWWSDETYRILGLEPQQTAPTFEDFVSFVHPDDRDRVRASIVSGGPFDLTHRIVLPDGRIRHVRARGRLTDGQPGAPERLLGTIADVTDEVALAAERDAAVRALADSEERYRLLVENAWDVIWTMGVDGSITYVSPSVERVRGITPAEAAAQTLDQIHPPETAAKVADYFGRLYAAMAEGSAPPVYRAVHEYYRKDGSIMLGELQVIPQVDAEGRVVQILGVTRDISERQHFEDELNRLAITDALTGTWNRRHAEQLFAADLAEARRYGPALSVLLIDIDHFKDINDSWGHQAGDRVLLELTRRITANLRSSDVLARWGGEEFVILMRHCTIGDAVPLADKLRRIVAEEPFDAIGTVTVSIGAAELHPDDDIVSWLHRADMAMYEAKRAGRNAVRAAD